jgi:hypothetical protein
VDEVSLNVLLKLSDEEARALDRVRGATARATWVKQLIRGAVGARERAGRSTDVWVVNDDEARRVWTQPASSAFPKR